MIKETNPLRLLVVEDNPGDYVLLEQYLQMTGLAIENISQAGTLSEAISLIKENEFDLALLDLSLPDSRSIETFTQLNKEASAVPIIVLSGLSDMEVVLKAISLGAQDYLIKGEFFEKLLGKSIQYSIERKKTLENLRISNERYELVNKATLDTIWEWDYPTGKGRWGEGIIKTFGYTEDKLKYDENWINEYVHPYDREEIIRKIKSCIESGIENWQDEFRFRCADGTYKYVYDRGFILFDDQGNPYRMFGAMTDVTEKKRLERELAEQQVRLQKLITETTIQAQEKEKNELGRELHDNINQILATVKMYLGIVKSGRNVPEDLVGKSYEFVDEAIKEIRKLSHSLVAPSLGDMGLKEALEELVGDSSLNNGLQIHISVDNKYYEKETDKNKELMLYRIVQEQLNNIFKYARATEVTVSLHTDPDNLVLSVADNGVGFNPSEKSK
ncbi:MAG TPA: PAS domain-containing protein, partial [Chitinophagaceae bacterium]|nr:PAS domain-containing protein [Chitinophagaceae bacterium]